MKQRREFLKKITAASVSVSISGSAFGFSAKSYNRIIGVNELIRVATIA